MTHSLSDTWHIHWVTFWLTDNGPDEGQRFLPGLPRPHTDTAGPLHAVPEVSLLMLPSPVFVKFKNHFHVFRHRRKPWSKCTILPQCWRVGGSYVCELWTVAWDDGVWLVLWLSASGIYSYETRRVILKQGHPPSMFYIMLTGTAIVNILDEDPRTGNKFVRTVHELNGGDTFGVRSVLPEAKSICIFSCFLKHLFCYCFFFQEIALIHGGVRTASIICKTTCEFLVVMKEVQS